MGVVRDWDSLTWVGRVRGGGGGLVVDEKAHYGDLDTFCATQPTQVQHLVVLEPHLCYYLSFERLQYHLCLSLNSAYTGNPNGWAL